MPPTTPGTHTHERLLGLVQPVGLVVAPAAQPDRAGRHRRLQATDLCSVTSCC